MISTRSMGKKGGILQRMGRKDKRVGQTELCAGTERRDSGRLEQKGKQQGKSTASRGCQKVGTRRASRDRANVTESEDRRRGRNT